jgi:3-oxoacyl-[acyl-carrier protein] reductase
MDLGLKNKTALVLAGGGGLGRAIAKALAAEGAKVAATEAALAAIGAKSLGLLWDLSDLAQIDGHVSKIESDLGPVDILVNNTGGPPPTTAIGQDPALWSKHFHAMVLSVIAITDRVLPNMRDRHWGRVITSTSSGQHPAPLPGRVVKNTGARSRQRRHYRQRHPARAHRDRPAKISR